MTKTKTQSSKFEKNIYVEKRCGAYRFVVKVYPLSDTATFSSIEEGAPWARRKRVELLEEKAAKKKEGQSTTSLFAMAERPGVKIVESMLPESVPMAAIFDSYKNFELPNLTGKEAEASRIRNLRVWFGELTLGQLDSNYLFR